MEIGLLQLAGAGVAGIILKLVFDFITKSRDGNGKNATDRIMGYFDRLTENSIKQTAILESLKEVTMHNGLKLDLIVGELTRASYERGAAMRDLEEIKKKQFGIPST